MEIIFEFVGNLGNSSQGMITRLMRSLEYIHPKMPPHNPHIEHLKYCQSLISTAKNWQYYNTIST